MFFWKAKDKKPKDKGGRTILGLIFNPEFGAAIRPIGETTRAFVYLLAMVFASQGLFPRNHPSLSSIKGAPRLTLHMVISTAWKNLTITKDTVPQTILFFAVMAILAFSALALFVVVSSLFIGRAHASVGLGAGGITCGNGGLFTPCDNTGMDMGTSWIQYLFFGQPMTAYASYLYNLTGQVAPQSTLIQGALLAGLALYSNAILIVAAIILFYHLSKMIVETAHHGVVMGKKADQLWAPIRLVFAIGLLVPIGAGGGGGSGLNIGQVIVLQVAQWGSNMADQVWAVFLNQLVAEQLQLVPPVAPFARKATIDTIMSEACMGLYNAGLNGWTGAGTSALNDGSGWTPSGVASSNSACLSVVPTNYFPPGTSGTVTQPSMDPQSPITTPLGATVVFYDLNNAGGGVGTDQGDTSDRGLCGSYTFPPQGSSQSDAYYNQVQQAVMSAGSTAISELQTQAQTYLTGAWNLSSFVSPCLGGTGGLPVSMNIVPIQSLVGVYMTDIISSITNNPALLEPTDQLNAVAQASVSQGWPSAGAWFNTIARLQADLSDVNALVPATKGPKMVPTEHNEHYNKEVLPIMKQFQNYLFTLGSNVGSPTGPNAAQTQVLMAEAGMGQIDKDNKDDENSSKFDQIFAWIDRIATTNGVWQASSSSQNFSLGVVFTGNNPLAEIANLGFANIKAAQQLFDDAYEVSKEGAEFQQAGAAGTVSGGSDAINRFAGLLTGIGEGGAAIGQILATLSVVFFTCGFMLAFYLPLIPFFHFLFNCLTWALSLFEAVIAVPLVALAHLTPEGDGLPGGAKSAYYFIFNIFLRPVLMVFGLIAGYMLFFVAVSYMNMLYITAIAGSGALNHGHAALVKLIYSVLYVLMLYMCANNCFKLINFLPENALRWMGQQSLSYGNITGDPAAIEGIMAGVGAYFDQKLVQGGMQMAQMQGKLPAAAGAALGGIAGSAFGAAGGQLGGMLGSGAVSGFMNFAEHNPQVLGTSRSIVSGTINRLGLGGGTSGGSSGTQPGGLASVIPAIGILEKYSGVVKPPGDGGSS